MPWEIFFSIGALLLVIAIAYGFYRSKSATTRDEATTEQATRDLYNKDAHPNPDLRKNEPAAGPGASPSPADRKDD